MVRISLVDDDDGVREATATLLRSLGYEVHSFASSRAFLDWSGLNDTSCLLADVMMPEIDGFALQRLLVDMGCDFPIIFLTAITEQSARMRLIQNGAYSVLSKPCSQQNLVEWIESAIDVGRRI